MPWQAENYGNLFLVLQLQLDQLTREGQTRLERSRQGLLEAMAAWPALSRGAIVAAATAAVFFSFRFHRTTRSDVAASSASAFPVVASATLAIAGTRGLARALDEWLPTSPMERRCALLAVFPEDTPVPVELLSGLWGVDVAEAQGVVARLAAESLLEPSADGNAITLLDVQRDYYACRAKSELGGGHARLLQACEATHIPQHTPHGEGYWSKSAHFVHHLMGCGGRLCGGALAQLTVRSHSILELRA